MWKILKWIVGITFLMSVGVTIIQSMNETKLLTELEQSDPEAYLIALKDKNEVRWLLALKELEPKAFNSELHIRIAAARALPLADTVGNLEAYHVLAKLEPDNQTFIDKVEFYQDRKRSEKKLNKSCNESEVDAYLYAKEAIKLQLKSPRSAKFSSFGQSNVTVYQACEYKIIGYVDAQNSFGAQLRSSYVVHLKHTTSGWKLKSARLE